MSVYSSLTDWRAYAAARGNSAPGDATDTAAEQALQRASDYIRTRYVLPNGLDDTADNVAEATNIAAGYELDTPGFWSKTFTPAQQKILTEAAGVKWTVSANAGNNTGYNSQTPVSPAIDALFGGTASSGLFMGVIG